MSWVWLMCALTFQFHHWQNVIAGTIVSYFGDVDDHCSKNFTDVNDGSFFSHPLFEKDKVYKGRMKCGWLIESIEPLADIITTFHSFDIEYNTRCARYDNVQIFKQSGNEEWKMLSPNDGYCGRLAPFTIPAKTKRVYIQFISDDRESRNGKGFNASFVIKVVQAKPKIDCVSKVGSYPPCNKTIYAVERDVITVQCYKRGLPNPTVTWEKVIPANSTNSTETYQPIRQDMIKTTISNGSIQLHNLRMSDAGFYRCTARNKVGEKSSQLQLKISERCLCPKEIRINWYEYPPYTRYKGEASQCNGIENKQQCYRGILYFLLRDMIRDVCGKCEKGHGESILVWDQVKSGQTLSDVKKDIIDGEAYDIYLPIEGGKDDIRYRSSYYFLPMIPSPGVAFLVIGEEQGSSSQAIFTSIMDGWPILVLTIVMAFLSGIIIWMLDTYWNEEQFPRSLHEGIAEGFWWAFVTMTTVGYGDIAPLGVPGRLFAIIWILTGLVIIAIFTSVITTSLTVVTMSTSKKLYGSVVGAIADSSEYRLGAIKNAEMRNYTTFDALRKEMEKRKIIGCLIDSYVAAHYPKFSDFRVNNIFVSNKAYGIVLGRSMSKKEIYDNLTKWIDSHKAEITAKIQENTNALKEPDGSAAMQKSSDLFNPGSKIFKNSIVGTTIILVILAVGGLLFEYGYLRPRHRMIESAKNLEMVESREVKEMAHRAKCLKELLLRQVAEFYERWNDKLEKLKEKHKAEQKKFLARGNQSTRASSKVAVWQTPQDEIVGLDGPDTIDKPTISEYPTSVTTVGL